MNDASQRRDERFIGNWMWAFPVAYAFHIVEEYRTRFNLWVESLWQVRSSDTYFLTWNILAALVMAAGVWWVLKKRSFRWLIVGFGISVLGNGLMHLGASIGTQSYTPGLATGIALWFPLAAITIWRARVVKMNRRTFLAGIGFGIVANIVILLCVFTVPRLFSR